LALGTLIKLIWFKAIPTGDNRLIILELEREYKKIREQYKRPPSPIGSAIELQVLVHLRACSSPSTPSLIMVQFIAAASVVIVQLAMLTRVSVGLPIMECVVHVTWPVQY